MNVRVRDKSIQNVRDMLNATPAQFKTRLHELEHEWDMERTLEFNASIACLTGLALGTFVGPNWYWFSAAVVMFLAQHAIQGWCPPMPVFRKLGFRTAEEIEDERNALLILRGDYGFIKRGESRKDLFAEMERNKKRCNSFVGPSAALDKEE